MTYLAGLDVSMYQPVIDHALIGQSFVVVKVSQANFTDPLYQNHILAATRAQVVIGGYHYLDPEPPAVTQADVFLRHAGDAEFLAVDVEGRLLATGMANARNMAKGFIGCLRDHDARQRSILMYSSRGTWPGLCGADGAWVADYVGDPNRPGVSPRVEWLLWQHSGTGIDRNYFAGTLAQLHALAGRASTSGDAPAQPSGEVMTNLFPLTAHRVVDLPAGTVLEETPGGKQYTKLSKPVTLGLLGATGTHFQVADGDAGVYVSRTGLTPRTADLNAGA